jgi:hypothetical protein
MRHSIPAVAAIALVLGAEAAGADTVVLEAVRDNTLYQSATGAASNGAGDHFFAGQASGVRRGLVAFDVASAVPAGATIDAATLTLHCSRSPIGAPSVTIAAHRVLAAWGEGASDAGEPGGNGAPRAAGDATWIHTFFATDLWATAGGDFVPGASASCAVGDPNDFVWGSTAALVADVQAWLDSPASDFGWILVGGEGTGSNARRFDSHEHPTASVRPRLTIQYTPTVAVQPAVWTGVKTLFR